MHIHSFFKGLLKKVLGDHSGFLTGLWLPWRQFDLVRHKRATLIISRVRLIAAGFALFTPLWFLFDLFFMPPDLLPALAMLRLVAAVSFLFIALSYRASDRPGDAYRALGFVYLIPTLFLAAAHWLFPGLESSFGSGFSVSLVAGYAFLPFIMVAGLAIFPLTLLEGALFSLPIIAIELFLGYFGQGIIHGDAHIGLVWLLCLIAAIATLSGISQLHFLSEIIVKSAHDPMTGAFNRGAGEELLEKYYLLAERNNSPLTLIFIDLDRFKSINDRFGHDMGDEVLIRAVTHMLPTIRKIDLLIRWGGEEFVIAAPGASAADHGIILSNIATAGLGERPDGEAVTASIGCAEYLNDQPESLASFIEMADRRMYLAKQSGRNCICYNDNPRVISSGSAFGPPPPTIEKMKLAISGTAKAANR